MANPNSALKIMRPGAQGQLLNVQALTAAGSTQTDAAAIKTKGPAIVLVTGADGTKGVILPKGVIGKNYTIKNNAGSNLKVYPNEAGGQINALGANGTPIAMAANTCCDFICTTSGASSQWWTKPLLPS